MKIAILDDYQDVATSLADWASLDAEIEVFTEHVGDPDELVRRLAGCDVVVAMRERTPFPAQLLDRLTELRLLVTTGPGNASIDMERPASAASMCAAPATSRRPPRSTPGR